LAALASLALNGFEISLIKKKKAPRGASLNTFYCNYR